MIRNRSVLGHVLMGCIGGALASPSLSLLAEIVLGWSLLSMIWSVIVVPRYERAEFLVSLLQEGYGPAYAWTLYLFYWWVRAFLCSGMFATISYGIVRLLHHRPNV